MDFRIRERESALAALTRGLEAVGNGRGNSLFIIGEAGLGKTTLLERAVRCAHEAGMRVLTASGEPMESSLAFGVIGQLFDDHEDPLSTGNGSTSPQVGMLRRVREEARDSTPLLIAIDDLQWADHDSLELVAFLIRRVEALPVCLIATMRPWPREATEIVHDLGPERAPSIRLEPLKRESVDALISEAIGHEPPAETLDLSWRLSAGNPLLTRHVALSIESDGTIPAGLEFDPSSTGLLTRRFAGLEGETLALARVASTAGVRFRSGLAAGVSGLDENRSGAAYETLFRNGVVETDGQGWLRFVHPLLQQALYDDLAPTDRERIHADLFRGLADLGFEGEAAEHAIAAGLEGDPQAASLLARVGRSNRAAGALAAAARHFEMAVRFHGERCEPGLRMEAVSALNAAGRAADAAALGEDLLRDEGLDATLRADVLRAVAQSNYLLGRGDRGDRLMTEAVDLCVATDPLSAVSPLIEQASIAWIAEGPDAALKLADRAVELSVGGSPDLIEAAEIIRSHLAVEAGDASGMDGLATIDRRFEIGDTDHLFDLSELVWAPAPIYAYSHLLKFAERFDDCLAVLDRARDTLEAAGLVDGIATVSMFTSNLQIRNGELDEGLATADRAGEFGDLTPFALPFVSLLRAEAFVWKGDFTEAERHLDEAELRGDLQKGWLLPLWWRHVKGLSLLWQGDATASDLFLECESIAEEAGMREPSSQPWQDHAVEAHLMAGRVDAAERVAEKIDLRAAGLDTSWLRSIAALSRGRIEADAGLDDAGASLRLAIDELENTDLPLRRAEALLAYGRWLRRSGSPTEAREPLARAVRIASEGGAGYLAEASLEELRLAGGRRRKRDRDELTPAELRVAREAAAGKTNPEIANALHLSVNTVRSHLKRVFTKLDVDSRHDLASRLERDLPPS